MAGVVLGVHGKDPSHLNGGSGAARASLAVAPIGRGRRLSTGNRVGEWGSVAQVGTLAGGLVVIDGANITVTTPLRLEEKQWSFLEVVASFALLVRLHRGRDMPRRTVLLASKDCGRANAT